MAIILNDNIKINAGKPIDTKYLTTGNTAYISTAAVCAAIPVSERYLGLTVLVDTGTTSVEYWFRDDVNSLIPKTVDINIPEGSFITGATNLGYFSGCTGIQTLPITHLTCSCYTGNYQSLYNYFFRGSDTTINIGTPTDGIPKRAYIKLPTIENPTCKSWIWNEYTGGTCGGTQVGWILIDGYVCDQVGTGQPGVAYYPPSNAYTATTWTTFCSNGSFVSVSTPLGSLSTGSTLTIGGRPFARTEDNELHFRTLISDTPNLIAIRDDSANIRISGTTSILTAQNTGTTGPNTAGVYDSKTANTLYFRRIRGSGDTRVFQCGQDIVLYSTGGTGGISVQNVGGGAGVYSGTSGATMLFRSIVGSGDTTVLQSGSTIVIGSTGGGTTYDLASPAAICVGGICAGTPLTGKTAFELFEELLVPELFQTLVTAPTCSISLSPATNLFEIGCSVSFNVIGSFTRGCQCPAYCGCSVFRVGAPNTYIFCGAQIAGSYACTSLSATQSVSSYIVSAGTATWGVCIAYDAGECPVGSKGTPNSNVACCPAATSSVVTTSIVGAYPIWATTETIGTLTKQTLQNMSTANNILISLVAESGGNKQKFEIPCAWLGAPTIRPLVGVCQWNTVSSQWEYPGGSAETSLALWTPSSASETVQGNSVGYCQYTYNGVDRSAVCIRLVF